MLEALGRTKSARVLASLVKHLDNAPIAVRKSAVLALGELGGEEARTALVRCAGDFDLERRVDVVRTLALKFKMTPRPEWLLPVIRLGKTSAYGGSQGAIELYFGTSERADLVALVRCLDFKQPNPESYTNYYICSHLTGWHDRPKVEWDQSSRKPELTAANWKTLRQLKQWTVSEGKGDSQPPTPTRPMTPTTKPKTLPRVATLLADLSADGFAKREDASLELVRLGDESVEPLLWMIAEGKADLESIRRAEKLVPRILDDWDTRRLTSQVHTYANSPATYQFVPAITLFADGKRALSAEKEIDNAAGLSLLRAWTWSRGMHAEAVSPDGKFALTSARGVRGLNETLTGDTVDLWNIAQRKLLRTLEGHVAPVAAIAFSADGSQALTGSDDHTVRRWDLASGKELRRMTGHRDAVSCVAFLPDGHVVAGAYDGSVRIWDAAGNTVRCLTGHRDAVWCAIAMPDGNRLLTASCDRTLRLWDLTTGRELRRVVGHYDSVYSVAVSRDGRRALSGSHDGTARMWDLESGQELARRRLEHGWVEKVALVDDDRSGLIVGSTGRIERWTLGRPE